jgi:hypothetical protein
LAANHTDSSLPQSLDLPTEQKSNGPREGENRDEKNLKRAAADANEKGRRSWQIRHLKKGRTTNQKEKIEKSRSEKRRELETLHCVFLLLQVMMALTDSREGKGRRKQARSARLRALLAAAREPMRRQ